MDLARRIINRTMTLHLLVSSEMEPIPSNITIIENYGDLSLFSGDPLPDMYYRGKHMVVKGTKEAIRNWLGPFDGIWLGDGIPAAEQFHIVHINEKG